MGTNNEGMPLISGGVRERLKYFIKNLGLTVRSFERATGLSSGYVKCLSKSIGADKLNKILSRFPELNRDWLLYTEGDMLKISTSKNGNDYDNAPASSNNSSATSASSNNSSATSASSNNCDKYLEEIRGDRELIKTTLEILQLEKDQRTELTNLKSKLIAINSMLIATNSMLINLIRKNGGTWPPVEGES